MSLVPKILHMEGEGAPVAVSPEAESIKTNFKQLSKPYKLAKENILC